MQENIGIGHNGLSLGEFWRVVEPLYDYPKDDDGQLIKDAPSILEKMALQIIRGTSGAPSALNNYDYNDLVQKCILSMVETGYKTFEPGSNIKGFLYTAIRNKWIDILKLKWPKMEIKVATFSDEEIDGGNSNIIENKPDGGSSPIDNIEYVQAMEARKKCLGKLKPPPHKEAFEYKMGGMKLREIAALMNSNINTVTTWINNAKAPYRACIEAAGVV